MRQQTYILQTLVSDKDNRQSEISKESGCQNLFEKRGHVLYKHLQLSFYSSDLILNKSSIPTESANTPFGTPWILDLAPFTFLFCINISLKSPFGFIMFAQFWYNFYLYFETYFNYLKYLYSSSTFIIIGYR